MFVFAFSACSMFCSSVSNKDAQQGFAAALPCCPTSRQQPDVAAAARRLRPRFSLGAIRCLSPFVDYDPRLRAPRRRLRASAARRTDPQPRLPSVASAPLGVPVAAVGAFASCGGALSVAASVDAFDSTAMLRLHWHCGRVSQPGPYRYYADFSNALHNHTAVRDCMPADRAAHRCVIVLGHTCTTTYHDLERQVGRMLPVVSAARMEGAGG